MIGTTFREEFDQPPKGSSVTKMPGIDILHQELLVEILKYLSHEDRLNCAAACKRFAEALSHPQLLKDIWFTIRREGMGRAARVLIKSRRGYQNLRLVRVDLDEFDSEFWGKAGKALRHLALDECQCTHQVLYGILRNCSSLTHLSIDCMEARDILPENLGTCETSVEDVRASLSNVKHLHHSTVSEDELDHILGLIPNTATISLEVPGQLFVWETLINRTLTDPRIVTELDLYENHTSDEDFILIMRAFSEGLRELRLSGVSLTNRAAAAIAECSRLRRLSLCDFDELENAHMKTILRSNLGLEMLDLINCTSLTDDGLSPIHELRKLRRLTISGCDAGPRKFLRRLGEIPTLDYLDLEDIQYKRRDIQSILCLENLKVLHMPDYVQSSESLRMICTNLGKLEILSLGDCRNLSDADGLRLSVLRRLRVLSVSNAPGFKDLAVRGGIGGSEMEFLTVGNSSLTDLGLLSLVGQAGRLRVMEVTNCGNITDQGLVTLFRRAPLLESFTLEDCMSVGDEFLGALADCCPRLREIDIVGGATSRRAVKSFRKRRPTVNVIFGQRFFKLRLRSYNY